MHGFITTISLNGILPNLNYQWKPLFEFQHPHIQRKLIRSDIRVEQITSEKFLLDKLWIDNDDFFIVTEGLITNIEALLLQHNVNNTEILINKIATENDIFFEAFTGNFTGFFFDKKNNHFTVFNNQTGTKKLFYFKSDSYLLFSTDLFTLSRTLKHLNLNKTLDNDAAYLLLTSGFMHDDYTLIKEVKQIRAGEYAKWNGKKLDLKFYFHMNDISENTDSETVIIEKLDNLFKKAVTNEFEFEKKKNFIPLTTLSGGLDSRMTALTANDLCFHNQLIFNYSERGYADELIAKLIAKKYNLKIKHIPLTYKGLLSIDDVVAINDGLSIYSGISHSYEAIKQIKESKIGIIHTGMLGDAVLGSYLNGTKKNKPSISEGMYSSSLLKKVEPIIKKSINQYNDEEHYKFYNRGFLGMNNGFLCYELIAESSSPFLYPEFFSYALSIPRKFRYKEKIYIKWLKTKHPDYSNYIWEAIGGKPTNNEFLRFYYRAKRAVVKRLPIHSMWKNNMNPEQIWYNNNPEVKAYLDLYFKENIEKFDFGLELKTDMINLYKEGDITEKTQVLTLIAAYKLLF